MDNPEKLATYTRRKQTKQTHNTICVGHHYAQTNASNVNKTYVCKANNTQWLFFNTILSSSTYHDGPVETSSKLSMM